MRWLAALLVLLAACAPVPGGARAVIEPTGDMPISGFVDFENVPGGVKVIADLKGLPPGNHGFHIHEKGDCGNGGKAAGGHFNPDGVEHGAPTAMVRHVGDLGNVEALPDGSAKYDRIDDVIKFVGPHSLVGKAVVIHEKPDDFGQPTGNAGSRIACGVIHVK
ncbi:MAG: superoxide dismutase family protein [Candidatus Nanoarchaeia archaeon]